VDLVAHDQVVERGADGGRSPAAVLHDGVGVVADVQAEVERPVRPAGHAAGGGGHDRLDGVPVEDREREHGQPGPLAEAVRVDPGTLPTTTTLDRVQPPGITPVAWDRPERHDRRAEAESLRARHPEALVADPVWTPSTRGGTWAWTVELAGGPTFRPSVTLDCGQPVDGEPAAALGRVLATVDALSYWKAAASPVLRCAYPLPGTGVWWEAFVAGAMGEFLWANGLDPTWAPVLEAQGEGALPPPPSSDPGAAVLLHSGGKDSIVAGHLLAASGHRVRPVTYEPNPEALAVVAASAPGGAWSGPGTVIGRVLDRQLLDLNAAGYLNGHTPYSALLGIAALAVAELVGAGRVAAGNGASDDEANAVEGSWVVNHQWSKSASFEAAWAELGGPGRRYASPLRPLLEIAVVAGILATDPPGADRALSCNRAAKAGRPGAWCGRCPKCAWSAVAVAALGGRPRVVARMGLDPLADPANAPLLAAMCGRRGPVPFECAGLPIEVRACVRAVAAADADVPAFADLTDDDVADGPVPPTVGELVARLAPAPLLDAAELDAARAWAASAQVNG
jgi:hypothetical protein